MTIPPLVICLITIIAAGLDTLQTEVNITGRISDIESP
jgi:hypothetical protein